MDFDLYTRIVREAAGFVREANLHHRGEALLHPELPRMIGYAHQHGIRTVLRTSGACLDAATARELCAAGLDYLSFSIDGFDRETYERNRIGASFETTVTNIEVFLRAKQALGLRRPHTVLEVTDHARAGRVEGGGRERLLRRFSDLPLDEVRIGEPTGSAAIAAAGAGPKDRPFIACPYPWFTLAVFWDGTVVACPRDLRGAGPVGDARRSPLREIWNGEQLRRLRADMLAGSIGSQPACAGCDEVRSPALLGVPTPNAKRFLRETLVGRARRVRGRLVMRR
jgi:MoaA/NifB/PqqE/SkfB family radical SAM enzyme